jgi:hypothetical protein
MSILSEIFRLKPRHKWFAATEAYAEEWDGPHNRLEDAVMAVGADSGVGTIWCCQGRKCDREERRCVDFKWTVATIPFQVVVPLEHHIFKLWKCQQQ